MSPQKDGSWASLRKTLDRNDPIVKARTPHAAQAWAHGRLPGFILALALLLLAVMIYGIAESRGIRLERVSVRIPSLPNQAKDFTILHLSDLHSDPSFGLDREAARLLRDERADLMIITGDFRKAGGSSETAAEGAAIVAGAVSDRMPVFAVRGNNDYPETMNRVARKGIHVLDNSIVALNKGLWLVGWNPYPPEHPPLESVLATLPAGAPFVLASHSPDVVLETGSRRAKLILAGHTHGIQIGIPGFPPPITLTRIGSKYTRGLYSLGTCFLYINRGIGTTMIPLRVYSAPEITILTLREAR